MLVAALVGSLGLLWKPSRADISCVAWQFIAVRGDSRKRPNLRNNLPAECLDGRDLVGVGHVHDQVLNAYAVKLLAQAQQVGGLYGTGREVDGREGGALDVVIGTVEAVTVAAQDFELLGLASPAIDRRAVAAQNPSLSAYAPTFTPTLSSSARANSARYLIGGFSASCESEPALVSRLCFLRYASYAAICSAECLG